MPDTVTRTMPTPEIVSFMGLLLNIDFDFLCKFRFTVLDATGKRPRGPRKNLFSPIMRRETVRCSLP